MEHSEEQRSTDCIAASGCNCLVLASATPGVTPAPKCKEFMSTGSEEAAEMAERRQEVASTAALAILIGDDSRWGLGVGEAIVAPGGRLCASWQVLVVA